jgi:TctA family transporter
MAGGLLGAVGLTLAIPLARPMVMSFGAPELFLLTVIGVSMAAALSRGRMLKGLTAGALGLLVGTIGAAPSAAEYRYTFGTLFLSDGLPLVAVALGIFGLAEIAVLVTRGTVADRVGLGTGWLAGIREWIKHWGLVVRGALVGVWAGVLPGIGATAGTWMAYGQSVATSKDKRRFGKGDPRGIVAPESANNAVEAGDLIPTLLFGIPGGVPAAMLLGALLTYGIQPGPRIVTDHLDLIYLIIWCFAIANVVGAAICFLASPALARFTYIRFVVLGPALIAIMFLGAIQGGGQVEDLFVMVGLGALGWLLKMTDYPRAPFLIGFVLALPLERYYYLTVNAYEGASWLNRPWSLVLLAVLATPLVGYLVRVARGRVREKIEDTDSESAAEGELRGSSWSLAVAGALLVLFVAAWIVAGGYGPEARLMPRIVTTTGALLSAVILAQEIRRARRGGPGWIWSPSIAGALRTFAWFTGFVTLVELAGFLPALLVFTPAFLLFVARMRPVRVVLYTVIIALVTVALPWLLPITLPAGLA